MQRFVSILIKLTRFLLINFKSSYYRITHGLDTGLKNDVVAVVVFFSEILISIIMMIMMFAMLLCMAGVDLDRYYGNVKRYNR